MHKQEQQNPQGSNTTQKEQESPTPILLLPGSKDTLLALPELAQQSG